MLISILDNFQIVENIAIVDNLKYRLLYPRRFFMTELYKSEN